ncbi:SulP family inorganic anion transporter [Clostridium sp. SYSU_GA19001]|uniref:SulP family inorganic anion transporter n=1 Tax=Clostridium caldaquaticum TaxID=2940653 RepID=UPI002076DD4A|nr:SulP family inorganic anion transporter [Clostridium caldaquaticum]MCM8711613.1 SulP family inorganic anion transporter [Clostridium caldaquaticum]
MVSDFVSDLRKEFKGYNGTAFIKDLFSGLTVTAVALPLALAFGVSSGATAASGMITAIFAGIVIALLGGASYQISGPTGAMTAVLIPVAMKYGIQGILVAGFLSGAILFIAGLLKFGRIVNYIPMPVITGFTSGIAVIIALGQIDNLFGTISKGENAVEKIISYFNLGFKPNFSALSIGVLVIIIMLIWPKKLNAVFPSSLAGIIAAVIVSFAANLNVAVVGEIPAKLILDDRLSLSFLTIDKVKELIMPAISIAALGMIESLLCGAAGGRMKNEKLNAGKELIAQGIGNMIIPLFGGVPATAAIARTSVAIKSGAQTRLTSVIHSVGLIISMFLLAPVMSRVPLSALAGVLMMTAWRMNEWESIKNIFSKKFRGAIWKFILTMTATIVFDLTLAIIIGIIFSLILFVVRISDIDITISDVYPEKLSIKHIDVKRLKNAKVVYFTGPLFFGTAERLSVMLSELENVSLVILSMRGMPMIDISGALVLHECIKELREKGIRVVFSAVHPKVADMLKKTDPSNVIGDENIFWSTDEAIEAMLEREAV